MWTALGAFSGFAEKLVVFDRDGKKWQARVVDLPFEKSWWRVLLAHTVYNPTIPITVRWHEPRSYTLDELKQAYIRAVDEDDDILTQFVEAEELKGKIAAANSFDSLADVYQWMRTDHGDEYSV